MSVLRNWVLGSRSWVPCIPPQCSTPLSVPVSPESVLRVGLCLSVPSPAAELTFAAFRSTQLPPAPDAENPTEVCAAGSGCGPSVGPWCGCRAWGSCLVLSCSWCLFLWGVQGDLPAPPWRGHRHVADPLPSGLSPWPERSTGTPWGKGPHAGRGSFCAVGPAQAALCSAHPGHDEGPGWGVLQRAQASSSPRCLLGKQVSGTLGAVQRRAM